MIHLLACTDKSVGPADSGDTAAGPGWQTVGMNLPGALLSVWGTAADDVWAVGADGGDGVNVRHLEGSTWTGSMVGTDTLWWVSGQGDDVWVAGEGGQVGRIGEPLTVVDEALTLFGVWAAAPDDAWTVGGDIDAAADSAALFHWDGVAWTRVELPAEAAAALALYKVWGTASDDVWAVGTNGVIVHWDGAAWTFTQSPVPGHLFTVYGSGPDDVFAVGGIGGTGEIVHWNGVSWTQESPSGAQQLNGVNGHVAVGLGGGVYERGDAGWSAHARGEATREGLHAVWIDPDGGVWAVGGAISSFPLLRGTLVYGGDASVPAL